MNAAPILRRALALFAVVGLSCCRADDRKLASPQPEYPLSPPQDFSQANAVFLSKITGGPVTYECGAALRNGRGGHLYSLQKIFGDGKPIQSYTTWSMNDDRQGPYSGRGVPQGFSIKGEWSQYSMQKIARGDLGFSWGLSPRAHGVPSLRPVVTFIDSRGRRLALVLDKTPDSFVVSGSLRWHDLFTVALQHGDVTIVVTAPGSSETRRFVIEQALLDSVERSRMRLQARAAEDLKDYRRRCRAVQTPRIT